MCKFESGQINIHEFGQPIGVTLHGGTKWFGSCGRKACVIRNYTLQIHLVILKSHGFRVR